MKLLNTLRFIFSNPTNIGELKRKIVKRIRKGGYKEEVDLEWIKTQVIDFEAWANNIDSNLWSDAKFFAKRLKVESIDKLKNIPFDLGGGGIYPIIYFLTLLKKPEVVVETGVAAGFSSQTFLSAMDKNGVGKLYSSDFPYFRIPNPEKYIGILVDDKFRENWSLYTEGDVVNFRKIVREVNSIDLFHYDSDKSYEGRGNIFNIIKEKLSDDALIIYDDIQDNNHFRDFVTKENRSFIVFEFEGKYVGMTGELDF